MLVGYMDDGASEGIRHIRGYGRATNWPLLETLYSRSGQCNFEVCVMRVGLELNAFEADFIIQILQIIGPLLLENTNE